MHHAYLLVGEREKMIELVDVSLRTAGPDVMHYTYEKFGIGEARSLQHEASLMPVEREQRVFVLTIASMTHEAQNALLKLFEDPVSTVKFYIITKNSDMLIPTLRSRFVELSGSAGSNRTAVDSTVLKDFLAVSYKERLNIIASHMKEKDVYWSEQLLDALEVWVEKHQVVSAMRDIIFVRTYERTPSASRKMLLEHLAFTLPVTK